MYKRKHMYLVEDEWAKIILLDRNDIFNFLHRFSISLGKLWRDLELNGFPDMSAEDKASLKAAIEAKFMAECTQRATLAGILMHYDYMSAIGAVEVIRPGYLFPQPRRARRSKKNIPRKWQRSGL